MAKFSTKNVETKVVEQQSRWIEGPFAGVLKVIGVFYGESGKKGTPGFELVLQGQTPEGFEPYKKEFPVTFQFDKENWREKEEIEVKGPISTTVFWMSEKTMDMENPMSTIQKTLQIVDALGVREEFDQATANAESMKDFAEALKSVAVGQKAGFLLDKNIREYESNGVVKEAVTTSLHPFGSFAVPAGEVNDLKAKLSKKPEDFVNEERLSKATDSGFSSPEETVEDLDFG